VPQFVKGQPRPANAGRKKGTPNKATVEKRMAATAAEEAEKREMPLDYMLRIMRDRAVDPARRDAMARASAPMCHPMLQAVAHRHLDADGNPIAPQINVQVVQPPPEVPRLTHEGPSDGETVQ
jgi:hypothetical protein